MLATCEALGISVQTDGMNDGRISTRRGALLTSEQNLKDKGRALPRPPQGYFLEELFACASSEAAPATFECFWASAACSLPFMWSFLP